MLLYMHLSIYLHAIDLQAVFFINANDSDTVTLGQVNAFL